MTEATATAQRNAAEVIADKPVMTLTFGDKKYPVRRLRMKDSPLFREAMAGFAAHFGGVCVDVRKKAMEQSAEGNGDIEAHIDEKAALTTMMTMLADKGHEQLWEALFMYDPTLPREEIEENGTFDQQFEAAMGVLALARPFIVRLILETTKLSQAFAS